MTRTIVEQASSSNPGGLQPRRSCVLLLLLLLLFPLLLPLFIHFPPSSLPPAQQLPPSPSFPHLFTIAFIASSILIVDALNLLNSFISRCIRMPSELTMNNGLLQYQKTVSILMM